MCEYPDCHVWISSLPWVYESETQIKERRNWPGEGEKRVMGWLRDKMNYGLSLWSSELGVWDKWAEWAVPSSVETEGKRLLNLQGHYSPRKAVPLETVLYWEEQGAEEREGRGGAFISSSCSESLLISDLKSSACMSVLVEVTWDSSSQRPFFAKHKGRREPFHFPFWQPPGRSWHQKSCQYVCLVPRGQCTVLLRNECFGDASQGNRQWFKVEALLFTLFHQNELAGPRGIHRGFDEGYLDVTKWIVGKAHFFH